jgi:hypothetical protein
MGRQRLTKATRAVQHMLLATPLRGLALFTKAYHERDLGI